MVLMKDCETVKKKTKTKSVFGGGLDRHNFKTTKEAAGI